MNAKAALAYLLSRLNEAATWRGLLLIATALGTKLQPEHSEAIVTGGLLIVGIVGAALPDKLRQP